MTPKKIKVKGKKMKLWYSYEFEKFLTSPEGYSVNSNGEDFDSDEEDEREYIECHEVTINDETQVYVYYSPYDDCEVFTDKLRFQKIMSDYKKDCDEDEEEYSWDKVYSQTETKYYWFHGYEVEEKVHMIEGICNIKETNWYKVDYEIQRIKMSDIKNELISYIFHPNYIETQSKKK